MEKMYEVMINRMVDRHLEAIIYHFKSTIAEQVTIDDLEERIWEIICEWEDAGLIDLNPINDKEFLMWSVIYRIMHLNDDGNWKEQLNQEKMVEFVNDFRDYTLPDVNALGIEDDKKSIKSAVQRKMIAKQFKAPL